MFIIAASSALCLPWTRRSRTSAAAWGSSPPRAIWWRDEPGQFIAPWLCLGFARRPRRGRSVVDGLGQHPEPASRDPLVVVASSQERQAAVSPRPAKRDLLRPSRLRPSRYG